MKTNSSSAETKPRKAKKYGPTRNGIRRNLASNVWFLNVNINGHYCGDCLETTAEDLALTKASRLIADYRVQFANPEEVDPSKVTFTYAVEKYKRSLERQAEASNHHKSKSRTVYRSANHLASLIKTWNSCPKLIEAGKADFENLDPRKVTEEDVDEWRVWMRSAAPYKRGRWKDARKGYSAAVVNKSLCILRHLFEILAEKNPMIKNRALKVKTFRLPKKQLTLPSLKQWEEIKKLMEDDCKKPRSKWTRNAVDLIQALAFLGTRREETTLLVVADIDQESWGVNIRPENAKGPWDDKRGRRVPIIPEAREFFSRMVKEALVRDSNPKTSELFPVKTADGLLKKYSKSLGIEPALTHHTLRSFLNTLLAEHGVATVHRAAWLGHRDKGYLNENTYTHAREEAMAKLNDLSVFSPAQAAQPPQAGLVNQLAQALSPEQLKQLAQALTQAAASLQEQPKTENPPATVK